MAETQLLRDAQIEPTSDVIAAALGAASGVYIKFIKGLEKHDIEVNWRYYKDGNAWLGKGLYKWTTVRGTQKEVTAFWLSIWEGFFKVTFFIPEKVRAEALNLPLDTEIIEMIENGKQMGKLKFFPVVFDLRADDWLDAMYILADFRKTIK